MIVSTAKLKSRPAPRLAASDLGLCPMLTCPHCWHNFPPQDLMWISEHIGLRGDAVAGPEAGARFKPSRFTIDGAALDARGMRCNRMACPRCHLPIARSLVDASPLFFSVIGVPGSGKSYFLACLTWQLRHLLPKYFAVSFTDGDPSGNRQVTEYEETLFLANDPDKPVALRKTELQGEHYDQVRLGEHIVSLPRPFLFAMRPTPAHPATRAAAGASRVDRILCLYDNAGEHFQPGAEESTAPVTHHLGAARMLMFLFDPTQDPRFRAKCRQVAASDDPQLSTAGRAHRQETTFSETAQRIRRQLGLADTQKHERPLVVVVSKLDVCERLLPDEARALIEEEPLVHRGNGAPALVDVGRVELVSRYVRRLLMDVTPEFVAAAEDFARHVLYVPVSALGCSPHRDEKTGLLAVRPSEIRSRWVSVPLLYGFAKWSGGLISPGAAGA